jgi:hypothetical protein
MKKAAQRWVAFVAFRKIFAQGFCWVAGAGFGAL